MKNDSAIEKSEDEREEKCTNSDKIFSDGEKDSDDDDEIGFILGDLDHFGESQDLYNPWRP